MTRLLTVAAVSGLLLWAGSAWMPSHADAQSGNAPDPRFAGLQWTFVRIRYTAWTVPPGSVPNPEDEPWFIDAPAAEQNLSRLEGAMTRLVTLHAGKLKGGAAANMGLLGGHH